jgi:hypothetical protein
MSENQTAQAEADFKKIEIQEDHVDPWNVTSASETGVDYDKLIRIDILFHLKMNFYLFADSFFIYRQIWFFQNRSRTDR